MVDVFTWRTKKGRIHAITVGEWITRWLNDYKRPKLRPSAWNLYSNTARLHIIPAIGNIPLQQLQTSDLQRLYNSKLENGRVDGSGGLSSRMIHLMHQVISGVKASREGTACYPQRG